MAKGSGDKLQTDFETSCKNSDIYYKRYRDTIQIKGTNSIADYSVYSYPNLFLFELKTTKGTSFPLSIVYETDSNGFIIKENGEKVIDKFGMISNKQLKMMEEFYNKKGIHVYFIIEMRNYQKCYALSYSQVKEYVDTLSEHRKSFSETFLESNGLIVPRTLKSVCWTLPEQEKLLTLKELTGKEAVVEYKKEFINTFRSDSAIKNKFYDVRNNGVKQTQSYLHYDYDIPKLLEIIINKENS